VTGSSRGTCGLCGHEAQKAQMTRHLAACVPTRDAEAGDEALVHLLIEASDDPDYWLHLEGRAAASLGQLDGLLRQTWLECCGHMSAFYVQGAEPAMRARLGSVFRTKGTPFKYEYDFGSTTRLKGKVMSFRQGSIGRSAARLLARNRAPEWRCSSCGSPAEVVCRLCLYSEPAFFCAKHAPEHGCAEEDPFLPVVNSPRMGVCGYSG
jgi:hypothetical protein